MTGRLRPKEPIPRAVHLAASALTVLALLGGRSSMGAFALDRRV